MFKKTIGAILTTVMLLVLVSAFGGMSFAAPGDIVYTNNVHDVSLTIPACGTGLYIVYTNNVHDVSLTIPASWAGLYTVFENEYGFSFSNTRNKEAGYGGLLFSIQIRGEVTEFGSGCRELLHADGKYFYAVFPGDVPYVYDNAELTREYTTMEKDIDGILKTFQYQAGHGLPFTDVPKSEWYYNDVKAAYEIGIINGATDTTFAPNNNLTYAEAVKLAASMHQLYTTGSITLINGKTQWYQSYVDYAKAHDIIFGDYNWNEAATRYGYIEIFAHALPDEAFTEMNNVPYGAIPDVLMTFAYADEVYKLYRSGIIQGVDDARNCNPNAFIKRSEVAAIITRMMNEDARVKFKI